MAEGEFDLLCAQRTILESTLPSRQKLLLLAILDHWSKRERFPRPGIARLMRLCTMCRGAVVANLAELVTSGVLPDPHPRRPDGSVWSGKSSHYDIEKAVYRLDRLSSDATGLLRRPNRSTPGVKPVYPVDPKEQKEQKEPIPTAPTSGTVDEPLALSAPEPAKATAPNAKPRPRGKTKLPDPEAGARHQRVVEHYCATFQAKRGEAPLFDGAEGTAVKRLLKKCKGDADKACRIITHAFGSFQADTITILGIARDPGRFLTPTTTKTKGRTPVQNSGTFDVEKYTHAAKH